MKPITELDMNKYQVAAFDWDGTLVDSPRKYREIDKMFVEENYNVCISHDEMNQVFDKKWAEYQGDNFWNDYYESLDREFGDGQKTGENILRKRQIYVEKVQKTIEYKSRAPEVLRKIRENHTLDLVLATNSEMVDVDFISENSSSVSEALKPDEFFDKIWTLDNVENRKPHPEIYQKIMSHFAIKESGLIVFEDSLSGVKAAKSAGADVLVVHDENSNYERDEINQVADFYVRDWGELDKSFL